MRALTIAVLIAQLHATPARAGGDVVLRHAWIVDVDGRRAVDTIVIRDGYIASIGDLPADLGDVTMIDLQGATVIPGLIDSHVHLSMVPGSGLREDSAAQTEALLQHHLRAYVACGVTTVVDTGVVPAEARRIKQWVTAGATSPRIRWVGPLFSPPEGYVASVIPSFPVATGLQDVRSQLDDFADLDPIGVKVTFEQGFISPVWPLYSPELRQAIVAETRARGLPLYVHALSPREYREALQTDPLVFVHPVERGARRLADELAGRQTYVASTLANPDVLRIEFQPERMDEPPWSLAVPQRERETALDPASIRRFHHELVRMLMPRQAILYPIVLSVINLPGTQTGRLRALERQVGILHEAGVPIVLGTDSGSWPVFPWAFHGPTSVRELELLVEAGLSPFEAIVAATATPARMLGLQDEIGRVAAGFRADLVIVDADPLGDISALRRPRLVVQDGVARTPTEWMAMPAVADAR